MESLLPLLIIISVVISAISKSNKQAQQAKRTAGPQRSVTQNGKATAQLRPLPKPAQTKPVQQKPAQQAASPKEAAAKLIRPVMERHQDMAPTVKVTRHTDDIFEGSMAAESTEGFDPCHDHELQEAVPPCELAPEEAAPAPAAPMTLDFNGNALVKAIVMQEVLTRPCDRLRR